MALKIPRLDRSIAIVDKNGRPTFAFHQWWDAAAKSIEKAINGIQSALDAAGIALAAADVALGAAADAQNAADGSGSIASLTNSGVSGVTITASDAGTDATITISGHTRIYGNGNTVAVTGGSLTGLAYSTYYYIYYIDPTRAGGAVTYIATTDSATAAQVGDKHLVGSVNTPANGGANENGYRTRPPGQQGLP